MTDRVLVIKHGALGDIVLATGPFKSIRAHHPNARITVLTARPYDGLLAGCPWFDDILIDDKPGFFDVAGRRRLKRDLLGGRFDRVYDLQTSDRSGWYFSWFPKAARPLWSGIARGCSHPHRNPNRDRLHTKARQAEQLAQAGVCDIFEADVTWLQADLSGFADLPRRYALLIPGGSAGRPEKRWPAAHFAKLAGRLNAAGVTPVLIGRDEEAAALAEITADIPDAVSLLNRTTIAQLAALARQCTIAVGNDSGPMHLAAAAGARCVVLFSDASDPGLCAPVATGTGSVAVLRQSRLQALLPEKLFETAVKPLISADLT